MDWKCRLWLNSYVILLLLFSYLTFLYVIRLNACFQIAAEFHRITNISFRKTSSVQSWTDILLDWLLFTGWRLPVQARQQKHWEASVVPMILRWMLLITFIVQVNWLMCTSILLLSGYCLNLAFNFFFALHFFPSFISILLFSLASLRQFYLFSGSLRYWQQTFSCTSSPPCLFARRWLCVFLRCGM